MVPPAGIEPALLAELDFESSASTNSATGARAAALTEGGAGRNSPPRLIEAQAKTLSSASPFGSGP
jgi:hypothetical protein